MFHIIVNKRTNKRVKEKGGLSFLLLEKKVIYMQRSHHISHLIINCKSKRKKNLKIFFFDLDYFYMFYMIYCND